MGLNKNKEIKRKLTKYVLLRTYYYKFCSNKINSYKLNHTIIYTKMTYYDDIKGFLNDDTKILKNVP